MQVKRLWVFPSEDGVSLPDNAPAVVAKVGSSWRSANATCCCVPCPEKPADVWQHTIRHCVYVLQDGTVQPPPVLEEGALLLQEQKRWWPFGNPPEGGGKFERG